MIKHAKDEWSIYMLSDENIYHWMTWTHKHKQEIKSNTLSVKMISTKYTNPSAGKFYMGDLY